MMQSYPAYVCTIGGHTDGKGGKEYNQKLSERRANSVKTWLAGHGASNQMNTQGFGDTKPVAPNPNLTAATILRAARKTGASKSLSKSTETKQLTGSRKYLRGDSRPRLSGRSEARQLARGKPHSVNYSISSVA